MVARLLNPTQNVKLESSDIRTWIEHLRRTTQSGSLWVVKWSEGSEWDVSESIGQSATDKVQRVNSLDPLKNWDYHRVRVHPCSKKPELRKMLHVWVKPHKKWDNHCSGAIESFKKCEALVKFREDTTLPIIKFWKCHPNVWEVWKIRLLCHLK